MAELAAPARPQPCTGSSPSIALPARSAFPLGIRSGGQRPDADSSLNPLQQLNERLRALPQVTIAKLRGHARAGGIELAMAADMRFAAADRTWLSQPESLMGIFPGGGGTQYLNRLVGRARALEIVLGAELFETSLAERYGWINRAVPDEHLDAFVDSLARRIAVLPAGVAAAAKGALDAAEASGPTPNLVEEAAAHAKVYPSPDDIVDRLRVLNRPFAPLEGARRTGQLVQDRA